MQDSLSPFLPGTHIQFAWDSTSLGWLKTCARLYQYRMIEGWSSRGGGNVHLEFGSLYHSALELYDRCRSLSESHDDALFQAVKMCLEKTWDYGEPCTYCNGKFTGLPNNACENCMNTGFIGQGKPIDWGHNLKTRETLVRTVIWYLEEFGENDAAETVQLRNGKPAVELSFRLELDFGPEDIAAASVNHDTGVIGPGQPYVLCGHLDRLVKFGDGLYVMDRKTSSTTIGSYYFDGYNPDNQMSLYTLASKVIYQTPVRGVIIDAVQIAVGFSRFSRGFTFRTESQTEEWLDETRHWLELAEGFARAGHWPMNDKSCHQYGGCAFRKVCSKAPEVRQRFLETDFEKRAWNPLEARG